MAQQEVMYTQLMHPPLEVSKEEDFPSQTSQRTPPYVGFVPFHQQQPPSEPKHTQPSLSLSLERPDAYRDVTFQQFHDGPFRPAPARPFEARPADAHARSDGIHPFDLEQQPFQHMEQPNYDTAIQVHHDMEPSHVGPSSEQVDDGMQLQIVPASEFPAQDQAGYQQQYPHSSASHEDVIQDAELFMSTLDNFLAALGTKLTVPKWGGKEMNLHAFYHEVTARGGLEQVIRTAQWKEVSEALDLSRRPLSTFFVLRKLYTSLLFHYEQVYFLRAEGPLRSPPAPLPSPNLVEHINDVGSPYEAPPEIRSSLKKRKRKLDPIQVFGVDPAASVGSTATGAINGKFEEGYFVTVVVGTEKLSGILYHVPAGNKAQQFARVPSLVNSIGLDGNVPGLEIQLYGKQKKEYVRKKDPNAPKRTRTAYNIFFKEQRAKLKQLHPETKGHGKKVIEMWNKLSENEKAPYIALGNQERERYLAEHWEKMKLQQPQVVDGADGDEQAVEENDYDAYDVSHDYHVSLDVESDLQSGRPPMSETMDQVYHPYHVNGPVLESELPGGHMVTEQAYNVREDQDDYPQEPVSEDDDDEEDAGAEEEDDDETAYPDSENNYEAQDGGEYQVSERDGNIPGDAYPDDVKAHEPGGPSEDTYPLHSGEVKVHDPGAYSGASTSRQQYYVHDHTYVYAPTLPRPHMEVPRGSAHMAPFEQASYTMQDNGHAIYPHLQQGRPEGSGDYLMPQPYFTRDRYGYSQSRQGPGGEALGLPVPSQDQGSFRGQDEGSSYRQSFQQNQVVESKMHVRQGPSEVAYQERYLYPVHMSYAQMFSRQSHVYPVRFPNPYPMQMKESQVLQYGPTYAAQIHQPQASIPEVSGVGTPSLVYQNQDGGHAFRPQDANSTPVFKHNAQN